MAYLDSLDSKPDSFKVRYFRSEYMKFVEASAHKRDRMTRNFGLYSGVDYKQWDDDAVNQLISERRPVTSLNLTQKMVDTVQGTLEQNPSEVLFDPPMDSRDLVDEINFLQETYDRDADVGNWSNERSKFILNGLIYEGIIELFIDYSRDSLGSIGRKSLNPFHFIEDPFWQSDDERDCRMVFKWSWMTAQQVKDTYGKNSEEIKSLIEQREEMGDTSNEPELDKLCDRTGEFFDAHNMRYKVIECVYMRRETKKKLFDRNTKKYSDIENPKIQQIMMRLQGESLTMLEEEHPKCKVFTCCPAISYELILADGDHPLQIGRLPFYTWSAKNLFGERQGLVDVLADAQVTLNKREAMATHYQTTASNGGLFVEDDAFADDAEYNRFVREKNIPGKVFKLASGSLREGKIAPVHRGEFPQDLILSSQRAEQFMEKASSMAMATQGKSEGANESGVLFSQKLNQTMVPLDVMDKSLDAVEDRMGEGYFYAFKIVYSNLPRVFKSRKTNSYVGLNQPRPDGSLYNDVASLSRYDIRILKSKSGLNKKREELIKWRELAASLANPIIRSYAEMQMLDYTDLPESIVEQIKADSQVFVEFQKLQIQTQTAQLQASLAQLQQPIPPQLGLANSVNPQSGPPGAREIASAPGQGNVPANIAGGENVSNNRASPSDVTG
jgi:hypothetical protein